MTRTPHPISDVPLTLTRRAGCGIIAGIGVVVVVGLVFAFLSLNTTLVDRLWFESVGQLAVWDLRTFSRIALWIPISVVVLLLLLVSTWLAFRASPDGPPRPADEPRLPRMRTFERLASDYRTSDAEDVTRELLRALDQMSRELPRRALAILLTVLGGALALWIGLTTSASWQTVLLYQHQVADTAATLDPIFGRPLTFYVFDLPFYRVAVDLVGGVLEALLLISVAAYVVLARRTLAPIRRHLGAWHLGVLLALRLALGAIGFQLDKFSLVFSQSDYPYPAGVGATDMAVRIPAANILTVLTVVAAIAVLLAIVRHRYAWAGIAFGVWLGVAIAAGALALVNQGLFVNPNPLDQERVYIANDIAATRTAYGLDGWETRPYAGTTTLSAEALVTDADTFANARLWDYRPLGATLDQLQTVRQYYDFSDVDIDRYIVDGTQRQVMLSAREMALDKNPSVNNWLNAHFVYTHGYGVAMVPVNAVGPDGLPDLVIRDLPVVSEPGAPTVSQPRIYFGERAAPWIVTGAQTNEFDYPASSGTADATTRWTGTTGIRIGDGINRLLLSLYTGDLVSLLTSPQIQPDSQFLMRRTLDERLSALAPFLTFDGDPYLVITTNGRLVWVVDAYTTTDRYPLARDAAGANINYLRNSVKAVVDAYDGTTTFYLNDPTDPLIAAWASLYPTLFTPLSAMPAEIVPHLRYPEGLFNVQTGMYEAYHVTDPTTFYQGDNLWTVPTNAQGKSQVLPGEAYYVQMRLPDAAATEYLLMQPMVPAKRPNMIAWIAARNDGALRGKVLVYQLPSDTSIFGPAQIEARIDQTPEISSQVTLWDQSGSKVIRGNLIVVPVDGSFVYLEPIYLQSTSSAFPQFTKIVVATPSRVVWADTLDTALRLAVGSGTTPEPTPGPGQPTPTPGPTRPPGTDTLPDDVNGLIAYANDHFKRAQRAIGAGDYVTYGQEMARVQDALDRLAALTEGSATPLPVPAPSPGG